LAANSVASGHVINESLTAGDLGVGSVGSSEIADGSVGSGEVANESLTGTDVDNGSIGSADIADNSLGAADIDETTLPFGRAGRDSTVGTFETDADIATKTIQVPAGGGIAWVTASAQLDSTPADPEGALIECKLDINENDIPVTERQVSIDPQNSGQCATNWAQSVGQGPQTFNLEVTSLDEGEVASNPVLQVMFIPFNENGA
jgi:hypothetical protein